MRSIGFRCWKDRFSFVVLTGTCDAPVIVANEQRVAPVGHTRAASLAWLRLEVIEVLTTFAPEIAFYKFSEGKAKDVQRNEFEGVLQEAAFAQQPPLEVVKRVKSQIRRDIDFDGHARYIDRALEPAPLNVLSKAKYGEAALVALCGLK